MESDNNEMKKNRIEVRDRNLSLGLGFFYCSAKDFLKEHNEVELFGSGGKAITTVVKISEVLKTMGLAVEKKISTSTIEYEFKGKLVKNVTIEILLGKTENFDIVMKNLPGAAASARFMLDYGFYDSDEDEKQDDEYEKIMYKDNGGWCLNCHVKVVENKPQCRECRVKSEQNEERLEQLKERLKKYDNKKKETELKIEHVKAKMALLAFNRG